MSSSSQNRRQIDQIQALYLSLLVLTASMLATALVVVHDNSTRTFSVFIFLLFFGVGIMLILGLVRGVLVSLLIVSVWISIKQILGIWDTIRLLDQLMELLLAGLTFIFAGRFHDQLQAFLNVYEESQSRLMLLDLEEKAIGLLKQGIGLLRLSEEEERSVRYRRPLALVLIVAQPRPGSDWQADERSEIMRAIATGVKNTTRDTDITFLASDAEIAIILPETETNGANKVVNNIFNEMITTHFITSEGTSKPIHARVQLRYGFAAFLGSSPTKINMLQAAEKSLQRSREINSSDLFQNIFIEWVNIGEPALSTPLIEKMDS